MQTANTDDNAGLHAVLALVASNADPIDRIDKMLRSKAAQKAADAHRHHVSPLEGLDLTKLDLDALTLEEKQELLDLLTLRESMKAGNQLDDYKPYPKQMLFHEAGAYDLVVERLLRAGNQLGKTWSAGFETAMHLTGKYPDWWKGKRFEHPTVGWAAGVTGETTRETVQRILLGRPEQWGTGSIPAADIIKISRRSGIADAADSVTVRHVSGGISTLAFKSYEQGREKFQGETLDFIWFDEEPDMEIYSEGKTRTQAGDEGRGGIIYLTFTPLKGMSDVVKRYLVDKEPGTVDINMTIDDALHYTPARRAAIVRGYLPHEREARAKGIPVLGSGRVFPVEESLLSIPAFKLPWHWPRIVGVDFGWDHPAAGVWLAWDREQDCVYVYDCYRQREQTAIFHAAYIKAKGSWIPVAWPQDGLQHGKNDGVEQAAAYKKHGANMLEDYAKSEEDGNSVEASVGDMLERMQTGRFKVFSHLSDWWEEFRLYHREKGLIVKEGDDIMSATRYGCMSLRFAILAAPVRTYVQSFGTMDDETGY
jgi:phage terminase large subunit-like protein